MNDIVPVTSIAPWERREKIKAQLVECRSLFIGGEIPHKLVDQYFSAMADAGQFNREHSEIAIDPL